MARTKGTRGKKLSLTQHKSRIRRASKSGTGSYTKYYYKAYKASGGKRSLTEVLSGRN